MSDNKKYYYIKLKDSYFEKDNVRILESQTNGYVYSLIILKLYLKSAKHDGCLMMTDRIPYTPDKVDILAKIINHDVSHVRESIKMAAELDIISILGADEIWMTEIQDMIGNSSSEADRKREYRKKLKNRANGTNVLTDDRTNVHNLDEMGQTSTKERDRYRDKDIEKERISAEEKKNQSPFETYNPSQKIDKAINHWNSLDGLPITRKMTINLGEQAKPIIESIKLYSLDEITQAINNYHKIQSDHDRYKPIATYGDVFGFLKTGIEKYWNESKPFELMKINKGMTEAEKIAEMFKQRDREIAEQEAGYDS